MVKHLKRIEEEIREAEKSSKMIEEQIEKLEKREVKTHEIPQKIKEPQKQTTKEIPREPKSKDETKDEVQKVLKDAIKNGAIKIDTTVKEVMITDVKTVKPQDSLRKVLDLLSKHKITGTPVVHDKKVIGIITESDIIKIMDVRNILDAQKDEIKLSELERITANEAMTRKVISINEKENITDASELMYEHHINRLPVMDDKNNLVGIVTKEDIIKGITNEFFVKSVETGGVKTIETKIDHLIEIVERKGSINIPDLSRELNINPEQIEIWARILEEHGMIEIEYPTIGPPKLRKKK